MYHVKDGIERAYQEHDDLLVIALTGRTGSGCTETASILARELKDITFVPGESHQPEQRKLKIIEAFAQHHWKAFNVISVSAVIFSFVAEKSLEDTLHFICEVTEKTESEIKPKIKPIWDLLGKNHQLTTPFAKLFTRAEHQLPKN